MMTLNRWMTRLGLAVLPAVLFSGFVTADAPAGDVMSQPGVWQKHEYTFAFIGFTSTYSCDGLADKVKLLLTSAGARRDSKSRSGGCASGFGQPDKFARAYLTFYTLSPADSTPPGHPTSSPADGEWRDVVFSDRTPRELSLGDCELVDQFRSQVLPLFTTRNVENRTTCIPHQNSGSVIDLKFQSFAPLQTTNRNTN